MKDEIDAVAGASTDFGIFDGAFDEVDAVEVFKIGALAGDEVIDAADRGSLGEQSASDVGADKACNSSDQISRHSLIPMLRRAVLLQYLGSGLCVAILAVNNVRRADAFGGVARVHDDLGFGHDAPVVIAGVVSDDEDGVVLAKVIQRGAGHVQIVMPASAHGGEEWVVVADLGAGLAKQLDDGERRGFAEVIDIALVGEAEDEDARSVEALLVLVESECGLFNHVVGHAGVDLAGELDEAGVKVKLLCLPRKIEGIDGDAMAAESRAGVESLVAEGLGFGGVDHFKDVDAHAVAELFEFVDQGDIDATVNILQELGHLRRGGRGNRNSSIEDGSVEGRSEPGCRRFEPADHLGNVAAGDCVIAGIFTLGREGDVEAGLAGGGMPRMAHRPPGLPDSRMGTRTSSVVPG